MLATDGEKVQCHICARWFRSLANHVRRAHDVFADEYQALFGLNVTTGLVGPATRAKQAAIAREVFRDHWTGDAGRNLPLELPNRSKVGRSRRLEASFHPELREERRERGRRRYEEGRWRPPGFPPEASAKGVARFRELMQDPEYRVAFGKKNARSASARVETTCVVCGAAFEILRSWLRKGEGKVCNRECFRELRRRSVLERPPRQQSAAFRDTASRLAALDRGAFEQIDDATRTLVRRHFGLDGGLLVTQQALARELGVSPGRIQSRIAKAVKRLLATSVVASRESGVPT